MAKNFVSNNDETIVMFKNPFLEKLSRIHWSVPLFLYVPAMFFFLYKAAFISQLSALSIIGFYIGGVFIWTFSEYILHRFVFHAHFPGKLGARISFIMHGVHHDYPKDSKRLVMVPTVSIPLAVIFYGLLYLFFGPLYTAPAFAGLLTGYLIYDMTHYAIHHYNTKSPFWLSLKQHHSIHHYSESDRGYGVSTKLWDHVFKTTFRRTKETKQNSAV
ncbi:MAG TPA: sterol desaturase family protein [Bacteroidia bacterium]|jgi:sterol desaturase/sphingolipid hydroxylase (fatty acid hydroxylase superfamily)|nr:sterol desaturase family protein [Bacteroidia bacterium]